LVCIVEDIDDSAFPTSVWLDIHELTITTQPGRRPPEQTDALTAEGRRSIVRRTGLTTRADHAEGRLTHDRSTLDPFDPALLVDPFPFHRALRADPKIHQSTIGTWLVARMSEVRPIIRDRSALMQPPGVDVADLFGDGPAARIHRGLMVMADPPMHTRPLALAERALTRRSVENPRSRITAVVDDAPNAIEPVGAIPGLPAHLPTLGQRRGRARRVQPRLSVLHRLRRRADRTAQAHP
jgi:hypothetical protein